MKTTDKITLYDLMSEDFTVHLTKNEKSNFDLSIIGDDNQMFEDDINSAAIKSFATFCRDFLYFYDREMKRGNE